MEYILALPDWEALAAGFEAAQAAGDWPAVAEALDALFPAPPFDSDGPRVAKWLALHIVQTKGRFARRPLVIEPWQYEFVCELYRLTPEGRRVYTEALLGIPRKNGKSTLVSGLALYHLIADGEQSPEVYVAAGSRLQAGAVFRQAKDTVESSPVLLDHVRPYQHHVACPANLGVFRCLAADAKLQHGTNPSANFIDEKWAHKSQDLTVALTSGTGAREEPLTATITTAGDDLEGSPLGEDVGAARALPDQETRRDGFLQIARDLENGYLYWWYGPPVDEHGQYLADLEAPETWRKSNPASWVTDAYLKRQRFKPSVRLTDFRRFHVNVWTEAEDFWLEPGQWSALGRGYEKLLLPGDRLGSWEKPRAYVAVDLGQKRDSAAVVVARPRVVRARTHYDVRAKVWTPESEGGHVDVGTVAAYVVALAAVYDIVAVAYDPWRFGEQAENLGESLRMVEVLQDNAVMCPASERLLERIQEGLIHHDGDRVLAAHVAGGATRETDRGWRLTKRKTTRKVDALIALVMAIWLASTDEDDGESVYEERDLIVL